MRSAASRSARANIAIQFSPAARGFWLFVESSLRVRYKLEYFALGPAGHQRKAQIEGAVSERNFRRFVELGFDVVLVGVTRQELSFYGANTRSDRNSAFLANVPAFIPMHPASLVSPADKSAVFAIAKNPKRRVKLRGQYEDPYVFYQDRMYGVFDPPYGQPLRRAPSSK